jgi:uncharacterized protein (UPF0333 family)
MRLLILIILLVTMMTFFGYLIASIFSKSHTQYLNEQYLYAVKKAQKANLKNKATAEFWYNESERYKSLLEEHQRFLNK